VSFTAFTEIAIIKISGSNHINTGKNKWQLSVNPFPANMEMNKSGSIWAPILAY
jgi:hypothetical protein